MTSKIFDKYQVVRRIAVGGMGEVFLAKQTGIPGFERPVILKSLLAGEKAAQELVDRFLDEARLVATLNHPNVVSVFEAGLWSGTFYMAMEYIAGWNLLQLKRESEESSRALPVGLAARIVHDAALGLDHAHHATTADGRPQNIVHRDVSPHNIMVRKDGITKVVDFGVAWALNRDAKTKTGAVVGKLSYMAPEQLRGEPTDARSDQFALGIVLWELLTRQRLFEGKSEIDVARAVLTSRIAHPSEVVSTVPRELGDVALRMLAGVPNRRFGRCQEVSQQLEALTASLGLDASTSALEAFLEPLLPVPAERVEDAGADFVVKLKEIPTASSGDVVDLGGAPTSRQRPPRRSRAPWFAGLALAVAAAAGAAVTWWPRAEALAVVSTAPSSPALEPKPEPKPEPAPEPVPVVAAPEPEPRAPPAKKPRPVSKKAAAAVPPAKAAVAAGNGFVTISTEPWSRVSIDGRMLGSTPLSMIQVAAGEHELLMENEDAHLSKKKRIKVVADETLKLNLDLTR